MEHSVRVGVIWKFAGQLGVQGSRLITVVVLAHLLAPSDYGAAAIAVVLASFAPTLCDAGMGSALVQSERETQAVRSTVFWTSAVFGLVISIILLGLAGPVGGFLNDDRIGTMVAVGGVTFALYALGSTSQAMFMRRMNFRGMELRYISGLMVAGGVAIAAAAAGLGAWALVAQQVVLAAVFAAALWWRSGWRPTLEFSRDAFRRLLPFAIRIAGGRVARLLELVVISLLIGRLLGIPELGTWSFGMSTVILPLTVIAVPIAEVLFAAFSRMQGQRERIAALWIDSIGLLAVVIFPLLAGLIVLAPDVIPLVFGSQWEVAVPVVQILSVYVMIRALQSWNSIVLDAAGRPQVTLWTQTSALCLMPVAVVVGARWGVEGVAVAFVVAQVVAVEIPSALCVMSELRIRPRTVALRLWGIVAATLAMVAACGAARAAFLDVGVGVAGAVTLASAVGLLAYGLALALFAPQFLRRGAGLFRSGLVRARALTGSRRAT